MVDEGNLPHSRRSTLGVSVCKYRAKWYKVTHRAKLYRITYICRTVFFSHYHLLVIVNVDFELRLCIPSLLSIAWFYFSLPNKCKSEYTCIYLSVAYILYIVISLADSNQWSNLTVETLRKWWITALPSMTGTWCFPSFYRWKIKLLHLFLHILFQILPQNHNCNVLNVFFYHS